MNDKNPPGPAMNQEIFRLGLSVETISVYLLCCSFSDGGTAISTRNLLGVWNSTREALFNGIKELEKRNIILKIISGGEDKNVYKLTEHKSWKL
ncbi:MAG: hypothetical protein EHM85_17975 [Desulfobacteraceae bacterium]|nr:MAG: hypothetical protein EHM85_17975 [Desulfobacteraceae bacterium]